MSKIKYIHSNDFHNTTAAQEILPVVFQLFSPKTVIDVGCGTGTWLKIASQLGAEILGFEGPHLDTNKLVIDKKWVKIQDLEKPFESKPKGDLVICLEVAEHLSLEASDKFIATLCSIGGVVLFSAAIPGQGGFNHINEEWQHLWIKRFALCDFIPLDIIRPLFWNNDKVDFWYKQNTLIFLKRNLGHPELGAYNSFNNVDLIHPDLYNKKLEQLCSYKNGTISFYDLFKLFLKCILYRLRIRK